MKDSREDAWCCSETLLPRPPWGDTNSQYGFRMPPPSCFAIGSPATNTLALPLISPQALCRRMDAVSVLPAGTKRCAQLISTTTVPLGRAARVAVMVPRGVFLFCLLTPILLNSYPTFQLHLLQKPLS